jgi:hypothetical protein
MMTVERAHQGFTNKCTICFHRWPVICEVDIINWDESNRSIVAPKKLECPKCSNMTPRQPVR